MTRRVLIYALTAVLGVAIVLPMAALLGTWIWLSLVELWGQVLR